MGLEVRLIGADESAALLRVAPGVFDHTVDPRRTAEFLADPRHHLAVAMDTGVIVGVASGFHYVHPDKAPELWVNEVGVAPTHRRRGLARRLLAALLEEGRRLGCRQAWVLADRSNQAARGLYESLGGSSLPSRP